MQHLIKCYQLEPQHTYTTVTIHALNTHTYINIIICIISWPFRFNEYTIRL